MNLNLEKQKSQEMSIYSCVICVTALSRFKSNVTIKAMSHAEPERSFRLVRISVTDAFALNDSPTLHRLPGVTPTIETKMH